jgi:hypothetical protein
VFGLWLGVSVGYIESRARRVWNDFVMHRDLSMTGTALIEAVDVQDIALGRELSGEILSMLKR